MRRRKKIRLVSALLAMMALLIGSCLTAYAATEGSISVTLSYANEEGHAEDGALTLYHVADIAYDENGNEVYAYTSAFAGCEVQLSDVSDETNHDLAASLAKWVEEKGADSGTYYSVNPDNGVVSIPDLSTGLYLLVQNTDSTDSYTFDPFLVSIPYEGVYDVDASPKVGTVTPNTTVTPTPEEYVNIAGEKIWDGDEAVSTLVRPEEVVINLYANVDEETIDDATPLKTTTVSAETDWKYSFTDLDKYDEDGNEIDYSIREVFEEPYSNYYHDSYSDAVYDKETYTYTINVTNTYDTTSTPTEGASGGGTPTYGGGSGTTGTTSSPGTTTGSTGSGGSKITPGTTSGTTPSSSTPGTSSTTASTLPQTGQLFWPIPFLAGGGFLCLLVGFILRRSGRRKMAHHAA